MQAPTPEFTDVRDSLFAGVMLQLLQYVKGHTLCKHLHDDVLHISKKTLRGELSGFLSIWKGQRSSRAREFHPHPLKEPCVKVSPHTALHTQRFVH